jgi:hypothetical protein
LIAFVTSTTVKDMYEVLQHGENEKEPITDKSDDVVLIYISSNFFKKENSKKTIIDRIKTSIGKQFKKQNLDFCDTIEIEYHSDFIEVIFNEFLMGKPTMYIMMMSNIDETCALLDIPGGKRRLGENSKNGAI